MSARLSTLLLLASLPCRLWAQQPAPAPLVDVRSADSTIRVATGEPVLARREVAERLAQVAHRLATGAVGLKVYSGTRADPGVHAAGLAVDLTLVDLSRGTEIPMGSNYPASDSATAPAPGGGREARYRQLLWRVMTEEGFVADEGRWWHYELQPLAVSNGVVSH